MDNTEDPIIRKEEVGKATDFRNPGKAFKDDAISTEMPQALDRIR